MRPTICSLFEPHHKQNLYTNPKRTAKSLIIRPDIMVLQKGDSFKNFLRSKSFFSSSRMRRGLPPDPIFCPSNIPRGPALLKPEHSFLPLLLGKYFSPK